MSSQLNYGKSQSLLLSGIAIIFMFCHHFFGFPEYLKEGITCTPIISSSLMVYLGTFSKICVAIYAFNTGYAMWANQDKYTYSKIPTRIAQFLLQYWIICMIFILYGLIVQDNLPNLTQFAYNLLGCKTSLHEFVSCPFAWYVYFYIVILLISPLILKLFRYKGFFLNCIIAATLFCSTRILVFIDHNIISTPITEGIMLAMINFLSSVLMGILVCKFNIFQVIDQILKPRKSLFYAILITLVIVGRNYLHLDILGYNQDAVWVVILIYSVLGIDRNTNSAWMEKNLMLLGKYSMNMWFLHGLFFTGTLNILQRVLYFPKYSVLVFIWGILLILPLAMICSQIQRKTLNLLWSKDKFLIFR